MKIRPKEEIEYKVKEIENIVLTNINNNVSTFLLSEVYIREDIMRAMVKIIKNRIMLLIKQKNIKPPYEEIINRLCLFFFDVRLDFNHKKEGKKTYYVRWNCDLIEQIIEYSFINKDLEIAADLFNRQFCLSHFRKVNDKRMFDGYPEECFEYYGSPYIDLYDSIFGIKKANEYWYLGKYIKINRKVAGNITIKRFDNYYGIVTEVLDDGSLKGTWGDEIITEDFVYWTLN